MANEKTGISGEFWFFSQLQRLGYEAFITFGNTKGIDIAVKLKNSKILTFEVKTKINFNGSFQYLNIEVKRDHYVVFINLNAKKDKNGYVDLKDNPFCYIIKSENLDYVAFPWEATSGAKGYGFEAKLLWYLKHKDTTSITSKNIANFISRKNLKDKIDFKLYDKIIWTLEEFEQNYYLQK